MDKKRIWFAVLGGVICACVCLAGSQIIFGFPGITWSTVSMTVANRLLLGFVIGISGAAQAPPARCPAGINIIFDCIY